MATSSIQLERGIGFDAVIAELERQVRAGVHPDRISVASDAALQWVCDTHWVYSDGCGPERAAQRVQAQLALLGLMLERGGDPNRRKNRGATPLAVCCRQLPLYFPTGRPLEKLRLVLDAGGDPRQTPDPALCMALGLGGMRGEIFSMPWRDDAAAGHADMVLQALDLLLQAGADIEALDRRAMYTPMLMAASMGSVPLLRFLQARGANPLASTPAGSNALMHAAGDADGLDHSRAGISVAWQREGDPVAATRQLLEWGLDPAAANARGRTPLRLAVSAGNLDVAVVLAEALAARQQWQAADRRLFKGSRYEAHVAALGQGSPWPQAPARPAAAADGAARRASWERAMAAIDGPTDWRPAQYPQWLRTCLKEVAAHLAAGADPRVPPHALYLTYDEHARCLHLSRTKSHYSRSGAITLQAQVTDWSHMQVHFAQLEGNHWVQREAIDFPLTPGQPPVTQALCDAIGQLCARHFGPLAVPSHGPKKHVGKESA